MPYFLNSNNEGLISANSNADGYSITLKWNKAYPSNRKNLIAYNIWVSTTSFTFESEAFNSAPTYVSVGTSTSATIVDLAPGQLYHFAVRAIEYNPTIFDFTLLPSTGGLYYYPTSLLSQNITTIDTTIPLMDTSNFPFSGVIKAGPELIYYTAVSGNSLIVPGGSSPIDGYLVDLGGGNLYLPGDSNIGSGVINDLTLVTGNVLTETWTIKCVFSNGVVGDAKFETVGSISGILRDGYGEPFIWPVYNQIVSNGVLSFSINETSVFSEGDNFIVKTRGGIPGIGSGRGWNDTIITEHTVDGYDGYVYWDPTIVFYPVAATETNTVVYECENRFDIVPLNFDNGSQGQFILADGYHQKTRDLLNTDLSGSDSNADNTAFPVGYYFGYQRTDPVALLTGQCVGSYIGGQQYCADGYNGVGQLRGLNMQEVNNQRQEELLTLTGEPICLLKRNWTGITCDCYIPGREYPENRCPKCYGAGIVVGYQQFFNPRRSDSRILVRFGPADDKVDMTENGLESTLDTQAWTLVYPSIHERDILVRFDEDANREFRYEVISVNRNKTLISLSGAQKMQIKRIRKTDPVYQVPVFNDTSEFPTKLSVSIGSAIPAVAPHSHTIVVNEKMPLILSQVTSMDAGHSHPVVIDPKTGLLKVMPQLGHTHTIVFPSPPLVFPDYPYVGD